MAFDGLTVASLVNDFNRLLAGGRINKIAQPEQDELILTVRSKDKQYRLLVSANASLPLIYFTSVQKPSPLAAPNFCMLLRKHLNGGRIERISQPGLERIMDFQIQHADEMGETDTKHLIVELMGKHSNIIFCDDKYRIIDSIKHVPFSMSSVRQVLPGKEYFIPDTMQKADPLSADPDAFTSLVYSKAVPVAKAVYSSFTGISPLIAEEICFSSGVDSSMPATALDAAQRESVRAQFFSCMDNVRHKRFTPVLYEKNGVPEEFSVIPLSSYSDCEAAVFPDTSSLLERYYRKKNELTRMRQKSADLRKIVHTALERDCRKLDLQEKQLRDTKKRDKYRLYGELLSAYGYGIDPGSRSFETVDFHTGESVNIPLDPDISPIDNAKKYFEKYARLKRTADALDTIVKQTRDSLSYLETISVSLDMAKNEDDLRAIKDELIETGYIKKRQTAKKERRASRPLHYRTSDGFDIYVGKNNLQNEELTFKTASGSDWWFHAKGIPGSHVIVKTGNRELPDRSFEEAARLAAHYSKGRDQEKVNVDYTLRKNVKKVAGAMPGFVIYHTNYSMAISPEIDGIEEVP